jgi:hypothetical protein
VRDFLAEIFSIDVPAGGAEGAVVGGEIADRTGGVGPRMPITEGRARLSLTKVAGGFSLRGTGDPCEFGRTFIAETAYRTRNGNPFKKYSDFDFAVGRDGVAYVASGADVRLLSGNRLALTPRSSDFHVTVSGFDRRRDVVIRVTEEEGDASEAELY